METLHSNNTGLILFLQCVNINLIRRCGGANMLYFLKGNDSMSRLRIKCFVHVDCSHAALKLVTRKAL